MVPENIAYGVTITPPNGEPVTGTVIPYNAFKWYSSSYRDSATSMSYGGFNPEGVTDSIYKTDYNDARITISSSPDPYECLVMAWGKSLKADISGDYTGEVDTGSGPPTIFKTSITSSGITFSRSKTTLGVGLTDTITNTLSPNVIREGVTINGITGTMKGETIENSGFTFIDWHSGGYIPSSAQYPNTAISGGQNYYKVTVRNERSADFTDFTKNFSNWMVLYKGGTNPINFVVNGSETQLTTVQSVGAYGCGTTTSPITSATLSNSSGTANAFVIFF